MLIALDSNGERVRAIPFSKAICPQCGDTVLSRCGSINIWHWAHKLNCDCNYGEGKGLWYIKWQNFALNNGGEVEVPIKDKRGNVHIADIVFNNTIIELQHSNIGENEIIERSDFYVGQKFRVNWVIDYTHFNPICLKSQDFCIIKHRKKSFDCLFYKLYGYVIFDFGHDRLFVTKKRHIHYEFIENDFGIRCIKKNEFKGYWTDNILLLPHNHNP